MTPSLEWSRIDAVLLDMDGTVLDLAFDNYFWMQHLPARWGAERGLAPREALDELMPHFSAHRGSLKWYCLDHWSELLQLNVAALKHECRERIALLPGAEEFLRWVKGSHHRLLLVTNAHPDALSLKLDCCPIGGYFDQLVSSHELDLPKEDPAFWPRLADHCDLQLSRCLFVDDSEAVLHGAQAGGVGQLCGVLAPDTSTPARRPFGDWTHVHNLQELLPPSA